MPVRPRNLKIAVVVLPLPAAPRITSIPAVVFETIFNCSGVGGTDGRTRINLKNHGVSNDTAMRSARTPSATSSSKGFCLMADGFCKPNTRQNHLKMDFKE